MRITRLLTAIMASITLAAPAAAGLYTDDLSRCLVAKATDADRIVFMRWMFGAIASHPAVAGMTTLTAAQHRQLNLDGAHLFERLMIVDCRPQVIAALKNEGSSAMEVSFQVLGQVAGRGLFNDPAVAEQTRGMATMVDPAKFAELGKEAGLPPASTVVPLVKK